MTHYLDETGRLAALPGPAQRLAAHLGAIVAAVTGRPPGVVRETAVPYRGHPGRRPCPAPISLAGRAPSLSPVTPALASRPG